jgi:predicted dehydrogenase
MKFAFLGVDEETLSLARYLDGRAEDQVVAVYEAESLAALPPQVAIHAARKGSWESLLHEPVAEAVIVATGPSELRGEQLVKLAKAGVPLLVVWPTCDVVAAYELEMIRRDTRAPMLAHIPGRRHPAIERLAELVANESSPLGRVEQAVIERALPDRSPQAVLRQFTRDVSLLRAVAGDVSKIGAMGPNLDAATWSNLHVQMSGAGPVLLRWSMQTPEPGSPSRLILYGSLAKATLEMAPSPQPWSLSIPGAPKLAEFFEDWNEPAAVVGAFEAAFHGKPASPVWQDGCRDVELAAAVERSLARGKTIELYDDEVSEEATFKGMMAVGGCAMLMLALAGIVAATAVEALKLPFRDHLLWRLWPVYLLGPIVVFLLLQFLRLVFRAPSRAKNATETEGGREISAG